MRARTAHTEFHADTASLTRTGDHLMKCISPSLWGMAEAAVQSHMLCSCIAFLTSACSSLHSGSQTHCQDRTHLTSNRPKQESNYVDQALKLLLKRLCTSLGIFFSSNLLIPGNLYLLTFPNINVF